MLLPKSAPVPHSSVADAPWLQCPRQSILGITPHLKPKPPRVLQPLPSPLAPSGIIYINGVPITKGNIIAGKSIIHEINGVLLPADLAQLLGATSSTDGTDPFADFTVDDGTTTSTTTSTDAAGTTSAATGTTAASVPSTSSSEVSVDAASTTAASPAPAAAATTTTTSTGVVDKSGAGAAQLGAAVLAMPLLLALLA